MDGLFRTHKLNEIGLENAKDIAFKFHHLLNELSDVCDDHSREFNICKTKLEEACFFAKKAMAILPSNQDV